MLCIVQTSPLYYWSTSPSLFSWKTKFAPALRCSSSAWPCSVLPPCRGEDEGLCGLGSVDVGQEYFCVLLSGGIRAVYFQQPLVIAHGPGAVLQNAGPNLCLWRIEDPSASCLGRGTSLCACSWTLPSLEV